MTGRPFLSVIVPTYNEKENMGILLPAISRSLREEGIPFEVLVIDDSSPDGTGEEVERLSKDFPEARAIVRTKDRGLSPSVIEGFGLAKGEVLLVMDADLSHPVEVVPRLYRAIASEGADIAVGSRHARGGSIENWPFKRKFISWGASLLARPLTSCTDPMSGFFAVRREVVKGAPLKAKGYKILLEVLVKARYGKVKEVPITFKDRTKGESKLGSKVIFNYLQHLFQLYLFPGSAPFFKFLFVGGTGFLVDLGIFTLLWKMVGTDDNSIWQIISFSFAVIWNFCWNRIWTFNATKEKGAAQFIKFVTIAVIALIVRSLLFEGGKILFHLSNGLQLNGLLFIVIIIVTIINYIGSKLWAFKKD